MSGDKNSWEVPTIKDELERKTVDAVEWLINLSCTGQVTEAEVKVATQAIFNVVSGLVSPGAMQALEMVDANPVAQTTLRRVFIGGPKTMVVSWITGSTEVKVYGIDGATREYKSTIYPAPDSAGGWKNFNRMSNYMLATLGMQELF